MANNVNAVVGSTLRPSLIIRVRNVGKVKKGVETWLLGCGATLLHLPTMSEQAQMLT